MTVPKKSARHRIDHHVTYRRSWLALAVITDECRKQVLDERGASLKVLLTAVSLLQQKS